MKLTWLASVAAIVACINSGFAQSSKNAWGIGIHPGMYSYYAIRSTGDGFFSGKEYGGGVELSINRYLSKMFDAGLETGFGRVRHALDTSATSSDQRDNFFTANLAARFKFDNGKILKQDFVFAPFIKAGVGVNTYGKFKDWGLFFPVGVGINIRIPKTPIVLTVQTSFNAGLRNDHFVHHSFGLQVNFGQEPGKKKKEKEKREQKEEYVTGAPDRDYDGVPDEEDKCPEINGSKLAGGCPDSDLDGVRDTEDKCPDVKGFANLVGCIDSDYDGVVDPEDKCPNEYGEGDMGCPNIKDPNDIDGDGVPNDKDACADVAGLFTAGGCPDRDGDGIRDTDDECVDYYGTAEHKGCPLAKSELEQLRQLYGDPDNPEYTVGKDGNRVDKFGNPVDRGNNIITTNGYKTDKENNTIIANNGTSKISVSKVGDLVTDDGKILTNTGGYRIDTKGNLVDKDGGIVRMDSNGNLLDNSGNTLYHHTSGGGGHHHGGHLTNNTYPNNNPPIYGGDPNAWNGGNPDPSGKGGGILIGNPSSDAYRNSLTGFTPPKTLTPEEEEYCQRIDLTELRSAIYFQYDDTNIHPEAYRNLNKVVEAMRKCAVLELQIAGHADSDGGDGYNQGLSEKRAQSVLRYITGQGINDQRLKYNAYGEKYPLVPNDTDENKQINRRAEIRVQRTY